MRGDGEERALWLGNHAPPGDSGDAWDADLVDTLEWSYKIKSRRLTTCSVEVYRVYTITQPDSTVQLGTVGVMPIIVDTHFRM